MYHDVDVLDKVVGLCATRSPCWSMKMTCISHTSIYHNLKIHIWMDYVSIGTYLGRISNSLLPRFAFIHDDFLHLFSQEVLATCPGNKIVILKEGRRGNGDVTSPSRTPPRYRVQTWSPSLMSSPLRSLTRSADILSYLIDGFDVIEWSRCIGRV